jgi:hypothetical protein
VDSLTILRNDFTVKLAIWTVVAAGLVAGTLDLALAITYFAVAVHAPFVAVPLAVASGLLGARAFSLGTSAVVLGIALHYFIALTVAGIYYTASRQLRILTRQPVVCGAAYGISVFLVMQYIVLPLSARPGRSHFTVGWLTADVASHIFFIGITIAVITRSFTAS